MRSGSSNSPVREFSVLAAFAIASAVGSALLFAVQPMVAKAHLPTLGGSPAVWITCSAFFQASLLGGYFYAHATTNRLGVRWQAAIQVVLLIVGFALAGRVVPTTETGPGEGSDPTAWLIGRLLVTVALPFLVASASAPMLQRWFSKTGHRSAHDPYFLYGASNLGGLGALLAYPILIEPNLSLSGQSRLWSAGYGLLIALTIACAFTAKKDDAILATTPSSRVDLLQWLRWMALAFVPSSLSLGLTTYLTTDVAPVPLLWVVPLAIYLITFVIAFARRPIVPPGLAARVYPWALVALMPAVTAGLVAAYWIPLHLLVFTASALLCHGELARQRPPADRLSTFYLAISVGGVLGGLFNAAVAPRIFDRLAEYPLALFLTCLALPGVAAEARKWIARPIGLLLPVLLLATAAPAAANVNGWGNSAMGMISVVLACGIAILIAAEHRARPLRFALGIGAVLIAAGLSPGVTGRTLLQQRSFFGTMVVKQDDRVKLRRLIHGNTIHGSQSLDPAKRLEPLAYYDRSGPIGRVFEVLGTRPGRPIRRVAVAGLGVGTIAAYAKPGEDWAFYELDPAIARVATDPRYFTFLRDSKASSLDVILGDARLRLRDAPEGSHDLIVLDAFSSDSVPVHLLTREALALYRRKLAEGGLVVFNITNRYLDLEPVLGALAADSGMACRVIYDIDVTVEQRNGGKYGSIWAAIAATDADFGLIAADPRWRRPHIRAGKRPWSDDFSDLAGCVTFGPVDRRAK